MRTGRPAQSGTGPSTLQKRPNNYGRALTISATARRFPV